MSDDPQEPKLPEESVARLTIYSETHSAQELIDELGAPPDEAWNKDDPRKRGQVYPSSAVSFKSRLHSAAIPDEHLADLLTRIEPLRDRVTGLAQDGHSARLKLALFADTDNPTLWLTADVLRRLGDFGLDLELDIYEV